MAVFPTDCWLGWVRGIAAVLGGILRVFCAGQTTIDFFYIHPDDIAAHHLPPWLIGCNAAGEPQHEAAKILKNRGKEDLMRKDTVPVLSFGMLVEQYVAF